MRAVIFDFDGTIADSFAAVMDIAYRVTKNEQLADIKHLEEMRAKHMSLREAIKLLDIPRWRGLWLLKKGRNIMAKDINRVPLFAGMATASAAPESSAALQPQAARSALSAPLAAESVIAEMHAASAAPPQVASGELHLEDRGLYHAADAMRALVDMGDAPSCHTCGAIMVRNGSCYKCVECGSTSGCS